MKYRKKCILSSHPFFVPYLLAMGVFRGGGQKGQLPPPPTRILKEGKKKGVGGEKKMKENRVKSEKM